MIEDSYGDLRLRGIGFLKEVFKTVGALNEPGANRKLVPFFLSLSMIR